MEEKRFTPGPWKTDERYEDSTEIVDSKGFSHVTAEPCAILLGWDEKFQHWSDSKEAHRDISRGEQRANARLISAAPELLQSLQDLLIRVADDEEYGPEHAITKARAAIAKALGKE
ncbi:hypothetical protein AB9B48_14900 [Kluyvera ascorbata]|uniref:hypothetical protein n=1 Tax=Kluyvera ascorbata TaxID=51288 RepID=UPI00350EF2BC